MKKLDDLLAQLVSYGWDVENAQRRLNSAEAKLIDARTQLRYEKENMVKVKKNSDWVKNEIRKTMGKRR